MHSRMALPCLCQNLPSLLTKTITQKKLTIEYSPMLFPCCKNQKCIFQSYKKFHSSKSLKEDSTNLVLFSFGKYSSTSFGPAYYQPICFILSNTNILRRVLLAPLPRIQNVLAFVVSVVLCYY